MTVYILKEKTYKAALLWWNNFCQTKPCASLSMYSEHPILHCLKKRLNFETVYLEIILIDLDDIWQKHPESSRIEFACFSFHVYRFACYHVIVSQTAYRKIMHGCCALQSAVERAFSCSSLRRRSLWIIHETDDSITRNFSDCSVALRFVFLTQQQRLNCVDIIISMRTASAAARTPVDCSELHQQPIDAVLRPTFVHKLCYKLSSVVTFTFIQISDQNFVSFTEQHQSWRVCLIQRQNLRYYRCEAWKTKSW